MKVVYIGGNHFAVCDGEGHIDVDNYGGSRQVRMGEEYMPSDYDRLSPPFSDWHCDNCAPEGRQGCRCSHCSEIKRVANVNVGGDGI